MTATHWQQYKGQIGLWAMVLAVLWWWPEESTSKYSPSEPFIELSSVDVVTVKNTRIAQDIAVTGTIAPVRQTILNARVLGEVKQVFIREGQSVKAGQVLVVQDDRDLIARLQQAEASLLTAKAELALAQQNLDRIKPLQQQNYASSNDLANAERQVDIRHAQVKSAEVSVIQAKQQLADMAVRAPYAGTVSERLVDAGQSVAPNTPLLKLVDLSQVELVAQVAATEVAAIKVGQVIYFTADGYADQTFAGRITRINPVAKAGSRRVDVYALVNNQKGLLRGGLFAKGYVRDDQAQQGVAVPFSAVQERQGQKVVHVIRDNRLVAQEVSVGRRDEAKSLALVTGLQAGERVLLLPPLPQNEGRIVRFKDGR
ncbi:MAG TPA: efflux RND transporter periplasmic adaptor subunit [Agitococcus sp.]|nr:efflux RND transporter periplasmic adaptor subunit [Agitococcus sp.]HMY82446.1 efflux RND transporter periplasmic adaptor subunit [Agitococcus sp.]HNC85818.1 efflux RND transporter periplasmic adaptor subunit [Agitococcus sp.]HNG47246.1 efflux RND transporter periplasmic adaptor subunit [Agitococcus sp.]HNL35775.1 efflux RND transporter periplasmic adaptor subunit [Agitococcus sp.]